MKKLMFAALYTMTILGSSYAGYVWGWYEGLTYQSVVGGMSEAKVSLSAAKSLRQQDPELALELLESNISWMDKALTHTAGDVPAAEQGNFDIVMRYLADYQTAYGKTLAH